MTISRADTHWFVNSRAYMTRYEPIIATADGLRASLEQVIELTCFDRDAAQASDVFQMRDRLQRARCDHEVALEALMSCVEVAQRLEDQGLLPLILQALGSAERCVTPSAEQIKDLVEGLHALMAASRVVEDDHLRRLLHMRTPALRALAVHHLNPSSVAHLDMLRELLTSPCPTTRRLARRVVRERAAAPWWFGWFRSDPAGRCLPMTPEQRDHLLALRRDVSTPQLDVADLLTQTSHHVVELPDPLVTEFARFTLADPAIAHGAGRALGAHLLTCQRGLAVATELLAGWAQQRDGHGAASTLAALLTELPRPQRLRVCLDLLHRATTATAQERACLDSIACLLAATVARAWPGDHDPTPVLHAIDASRVEHPEQLNALAIQLIELLPRLDPSVVPWEHLADCVTEGFVGPWATAEPYVEGLLKQTAPEIAAQLTRRLIARGADPIASWALEQIALLHLWSDPGPDAAVRRLLADARLRALLFQAPAAIQTLLPQLRRHLSRGDCTLAEATCVMRALREAHRRHFMSDGRAHMFSAFEHRDAAPSHGGGGPTPDEWRAWRALRDAHQPRDADFWDAALSVLPPAGCWSDSDHALVDDARDHSLPLNVFKLAVALKARGAPGDLRHLRQLIDSAQGHTRRMLMAIADQLALG